MSLSLSESSARSGGHCWVERRLFEVLGAWAPATGLAEATVLLDRHSLHAAWRAGQWWERLPLLAEVDRDALVAPPAGWERLLGPAGGPPPPPPGPVAALALVYRVVLPRLLASYREHAGRASPVADGPVLRTLRHAADDVRADREEGEAALLGLLDDETTVEDAAAAVRRAEKAWLVTD